MLQNQLKVEIIDSRSVADQYYGHVAEVKLFSDEDLLTDKWGGVKLVKEEINSMNQIIILTNTTLTTHTPLGAYIYIYETHIDLRATRNLQLHSSALASYDTLSNFNMDTIIKK